MNRFIILSGCSGGGKSTLLKELTRRGFTTIEEPGRRIVAEEMQIGGTALPWIDMSAFARRAIALGLSDRETAPTDGLVFFDRSLIDAASALHKVIGNPFINTLRRHHRYNRHVFLTPPWPEIYQTDGERQHGFEEALEEYERLLNDYRQLDYETTILPKTSVSDRVESILQTLNRTTRQPAARYILT